MLLQIMAVTSLSAAVKLDVLPKEKRVVINTIFVVQIAIESFNELLTDNVQQNERD